MPPKRQVDKVIEDVFQNLLTGVRETAYSKVSRDERLAYYRLMSSLENAGKKDWKQTIRKDWKLMIGKVIEMVVFCSLAATLAWSLTREGKNKQPRQKRVRTWEWIVMAMALVSGLSVVRLLTFAFALLIKRWWLIHKYVVYLINGLKWSVDITLYLILLLLCWRFWLLPRLKHLHRSEVRIWIIPAPQVTWFLVALCAGSLLWLLKNSLYMILEANICYLKLFERIRYTIPSVHAMNIIHNSGIYEWDVTANGLWMDVCIMKRENVPIWILQRLSEEYLHQLKILRPELMLLSSNTGIIQDDFKLQMYAAEMFEHIKTRNPTRPKGWDYQSMHDLRGQEIKRKELELYSSCPLSTKEMDFIFQPRLIKSIDDEVPEDEIGSGGRTRETIPFNDFLKLAVKGYKVSTFLKHNLEGSMKMFVKLNRLLNALVLAIVFFSWLLLSKIVSTGQIAILFSPFLAASFIFGDSCKRIFDGFIFAFAMHPFEVGDRVIINDVQMRVTGLNILTSTFLKYDTGEGVFISNPTLMSTNITNTGEEVMVPYSTDNVEFVIDAETPLQDIQILEDKILMLMNNSQGHYDPRVVIAEIGKEHMKMMVVFSYPNPTLTAETKNLHKSRIFRRLMKLLKEVKEVGECVKDNLPSYPIVEISLKRKVKMEDIDNIEAEIVSGLEKRYRHCCKVVLVELTKSTLKMGLYVGDPLQTNEAVVRKEAETEIHPLHPELLNNLDAIAQSVAAMTRLVLDVKIYHVYAKRKIGWDVLKPEDIIMTQG